MDYTTIASEDRIERTLAALKERNIEPILVNTKEEALAKIKELIPKDASVYNGSSRTLQEIGYIDMLKSGEHPWENLQAPVVAETDPVKQAELRKKALFADFYLGSVHALAETGELLIASASGSQIPSIAFTSKNLIFVVGAQKITPTYEEAMKRIHDHVVPLEDARMKSTGAPGTVFAKLFTFEREPVFMGRTVRLILIRESLGF